MIRNHKMTTEPRETGAPPLARRLLRTMALGGLIVGVLDISEPIAFYGLRGVPAQQILQSVASGWLGRAAYQGGWRTALLGLATHFFIATVVVTVYALASTRWRALMRQPWLWGPVYGLAVYAIMYHVVMLLSAIGRTPPFSWPTFASAIFAHVFCVGLPTALVTRRTLR